MKDQTLVIIPARLGSTRLPEKPLIKIGDISMIARVATQVIKSGLDNIYIATDSEKIADELLAYDVKSILTDPSCPSGTDRTFAAWNNMPNKADFKYIINVQGDMPFIDPSIISKVAKALWESNCDIVTPVAKVGLREAESESNVKVVSTPSKRAIYFSRSLIPNGATEFLYHVGVYGYKAKSLSHFVSLPVSEIEKTERLEQLRALENGMTIEICEVDSIPISIDTEEDLKKAKDYYNHITSLNV